MLTGYLACDKLFDTCCLSIDRFEHGIDAVKFGCAWGLMWEGSGQVVACMCTHVGRLDSYMLGFRLVYQICGGVTVHSSAIREFVGC